jgi:uncharacterized membrane protein
MNGKTVAQALGWFSIGLGLAELVAPRKMAKATGLTNKSGLMPLLGIREITSGVGILASERPSPWLWSRVAGDVMDLAVLGSGCISNPRNRTRLAIAGAMVAGVTAVDYLCSQEMSAEEKQPGRNGNGSKDQNLFRTITINKSAKALYESWRSAEMFPAIIPGLKSVTSTGPTTQHWVAAGPGGADIEWDAEIVEDRVGDRISWRSLPGAAVANSGTVRFEELPNDRGTVVRLKMDYDPPVGGLGAKLSKLFGKAPEQQATEFLRKFKQWIETGEIATTVGQPAGRKLSYSPKFDVAARKMAEAI